MTPTADDVIPHSRPYVQSYTCYRSFMQDFYLYKKDLKTGFSFRRFSEMARIKSPNYLQLVMRGQRNMSEVVGRSVSKVMGLNSAEASYFMALVRRDNARDAESAESAHKDLLRAVKKLVATKMNNEKQGKILSHWYHLVIREMVFLPDFKAEGQWISERMRGVITPKEAAESVRLLKESGFIVMDPETGAMKAADPVVDTGDAFDFARILNAHQENLGVWRQIITSLGKEERELGLLNIPISSSRIPEFKERVRAFQEEIIGWLQNESSPDQVVQLGCYLIPITRRT